MASAMKPGVGFVKARRSDEEVVAALRAQEAIARARRQTVSVGASQADRLYTDVLEDHYSRGGDRPAAGCTAAAVELVDSRRSSTAQPAAGPPRAVPGKREAQTTELAADDGEHKAASRRAALKRVRDTSDDEAASPRDSSSPTGSAGGGGGGAGAGAGVKASTASVSAQGYAATDIGHCAACGVAVGDGEWAAHAASTAHLFSRWRTPRRSHIWIPPSNRGFQMLRRAGWDEVRGVGKDEGGRLEPVATVFKTDRRGLGASTGARTRRRITHFPSHVEAEARASRDGLSRAERAHITGNPSASRKPLAAHLVAALPVSAEVRAAARVAARRERRVAARAREKTERRIRNTFSEHIPEGFEGYFDA